MLLSSMIVFLTLLTLSTHYQMTPSHTSNFIGLSKLGVALLDHAWLARALMESALEVLVSRLGRPLRHAHRIAWLMHVLGAAIVHHLTFLDPTDPVT